MKATVKAYSKVNLSLDITGKRPDGYHTLRSVMQSVSLCDTITLTLNNSSKKASLSLTCSDKAINCEQNLGLKAAEGFFKAAGIIPDCNIHIEKCIPLAGGLGGGSADAAAILGALNALWDEPLNKTELLKIALSLGADVPFCLLGGTYLAEGIGEKLTRLPKMPECRMLIAKKGVKNSTGEMYRILDTAENVKTSDLGIIKEGLISGDVHRIVGGFYNCFETVCGDEPLSVKQIMLQKGAIYSGLSGAGPSVVGIFEDDKHLASAENELKTIGAEVFRCVPTPKGWEFV